MDIEVNKASYNLRFGISLPLEEIERMDPDKEE